MFRPFRTLYRIYVDGFRNIGITGKSLLIILAVKLFIMFAVLKIFFFPNFLKHNFDNDSERSGHVINQIINTK